jgi:hypothetical protein
MDIMRALTEKKARELVAWKDAMFKDAADAVIKRANPSWERFSQFLRFPRQNGKPGIIFDALTSTAAQYLDETLSRNEKIQMKLALDYEVILAKSEEDGGGFEAMAEAYAAGVPLEDILA